VAFGELEQDRNARACGFSWLQSCKGLAGRAVELLASIDALPDGPARFRVLAEQAIEVGVQAEPDHPRLRLRAFQHAFRFDRDEAAARVAGERYVDCLRGDAQELNAFAWQLLTDERFAGHCQELALHAARVMSECADWRTYWRLDTLALACFENGRIDEAVALQAEAVEGADAASRPRYQVRLDRYRAAREVR
jgi:hypothetical protein